MIKDCPYMKMSKRRDDKKKWAYQSEWDESESKSSSDDSSEAEVAQNYSFLNV